MTLPSAQAMIIDLLTIRADRDNYYYGGPTAEVSWYTKNTTGATGNHQGK